MQGFFRRSIQQKIQYRPCLKNQQCNIMRVNRNRCQYCRCVLVKWSRFFLLSHGRQSRVLPVRSYFCMVTWWRVNKASWLFLILKDWIINLKQNINKLVMISHAFSHSSYLMFFRNFIFRSYSFLQWNFQIWIKICRCFKVHIFLALGQVFII